MAIIISLDEVLKQRNVSVTQLAAEVGISRVNMSHVNSGNIKAIRFSTLEGICRYLDCQPGDILQYVPDGPEESSASPAEMAPQAAAQPPASEKARSTIN